jgi:hypothetical protein
MGLPETAGSPKYLNRYQATRFSFCRKWRRPVTPFGGKGEKMKGIGTRSLGLGRYGSVIFVALMLVTICRSAHATVLEWQPRSDDLLRTTLIRLPPITRPTVDVDEEGNVVLRNGMTAIALIYDPDRTGDARKERLGLAPPPHRDNAGFGGISVKLALTF